METNSKHLDRSGRLPVYRITEVIENDGAPCLIPDVAFHPSGAYFAVTYQDLNEVRIYESRTRKLLHVLRNPESQLDEPHGVFYSENYLVVTNRHRLKKPSAINVYRNGGSNKKPIQIFQTPFDHLREAHSLALRDGRLVATYCENVGRAGAIVCYGFNQKTGQNHKPSGQDRNLVFRVWARQRDMFQRRWHKIIGDIPVGRLGAVFYL